jgi:hypothetical protein
LETTNQVAAKLLPSPAATATGIRHNQIGVKYVYTV